MTELVSVIIPCFNAERWIQEAIDSSLNQTYSNTEVIVIDDGSTDNSLKIIQSYGDRIVFDSDNNQGGNVARNKGLAFAKGTYIQFLDADDYILPQKIERQVYSAKQTGADVIYGDWRHKRHLPDGSAVLEDVQISGEQSDILESLLSDWWVSPACLLFKRSIIDKVGGWDEAMQAGQDRDFLLSVVMHGAKVVYQPGCYSVYRRYGNITVSTKSKERYLSNHLKILEKCTKRLTSNNLLTPKYERALAQSYFLIARGYLNLNSELYYKYLDQALTLDPKFKPKITDRTLWYNAVQNLLGFRRTERLTLFLKNLKKTTHA